MDKQALKEFTYGGVAELMRNRKYYYHSNADITYSHWTEDGKTALIEYMSFIGYKMLEAEEAELKQRAKDMVINGLKGEKV